MRLLSFYKLIILIMLSLCLISCSAEPSFSNETYIVNKLVKQHRIWKGTPYRLGGNTPQGVDCSGLTAAIFKNSFGIHLPRTTKLQAKTGAYVPKKYLQAGDLVFFKTGRGPFGNHVGIYVKNGHFLHASSKKGVIYSNLNSPYYKRVYWQARRLQ